jgi:DNA topoisomerase-1
MDLNKALALLALPRTIGRHPESGEPITAGIGRFGPYIKHGPTYKSLGVDDDVLTIGLNRAVALLAEPSKGRGPRGAGGRSLGNHPQDGKPVTVGTGRYGPYVRHERLFASIPRDIDPQSVTLEQAVELLQAQAAKGKNGSKAKKTTPGSGKKGKASRQAEKPASGRRRAATSE